jgi:hypothetical protein
VFWCFRRRRPAFCALQLRQYLPSPLPARLAPLAVALLTHQPPPSLWQLFESPGTGRQAGSRYIFCYAGEGKRCQNFARLNGTAAAASAAFLRHTTPPRSSCLLAGRLYSPQRLLSVQRALSVPASTLQTAFDTCAESAANIPLYRARD